MAQPNSEIPPFVPVNRDPTPEPYTVPNERFRQGNSNIGPTNTDEGFETDDDNIGPTATPSSGQPYTPSQPAFKQGGK